MSKLDYYTYWFFARYADKLPYLKYLRDKRINYKNYTCFNFWYRPNIKEFWLYRFIEHNKLNKSGKKVNFISVFWSRKILKYIDWIKIFFTWEYIWKDRFSEYDDYCLNDVDLSIWFREYNNIDNYIRLPLWIIYLFKAENTSLDDIKKSIDALEKAKLNFLNRKKFCALISRHDDEEKTRTNAFYMVSKYWQVDCPWKLLHNMDVNIPKYQDKIDYLQNYKYSICPENKEDKWYVTEKIIDSYKAWCIPIYKWIFGELEKNVFNEDCIIYMNNINNLTMSSDKEKNFVESKIFKKWSSEYIYIRLLIILKKKLNMF